MLGTLHFIIRNYSKKNKHINIVNVDLEITRSRKKPQGGSRYLKDKKQVYLFNAWYINLLFTKYIFS